MKALLLLLLSGAALLAADSAEPVNPDRAPTPAAPAEKPSDPVWVAFTSRANSFSSEPAEYYATLEKGAFLGLLSLARPSGFVKFSHVCWMQRGNVHRLAGSAHGGDPYGYTNTLYLRVELLQRIIPLDPAFVRRHFESLAAEPDPGDDPAWVAVLTTVDGAGKAPREYLGAVARRVYDGLLDTPVPAGFLKLSRIFWLDQGKLRHLSDPANGVTFGYGEDTYFRAETILRIIPLDPRFIRARVTDPPESKPLPDEPVDASPLLKRDTKPLQMLGPELFPQKPLLDPASSAPVKPAESPQ